MDIRVEREKKHLTQRTLKEIEARNVDYYINEHLKLLKTAMDAQARDQVNFHRAQLMKLVVARYKIDPEDEIDREY